MTQVKLDEIGDLHFIFKNTEYNNLISYKLDNGAEVDFDNDECVGFVLPNFERQLGRGKINNILLKNITMEESNIVFDLNVDGQIIQGKVDFSSLKR